MDIRSLIQFTDEENAAIAELGKLRKNMHRAFNII